MRDESQAIVRRSREKLEFPLIIDRLSALAVSREGKALCEKLLPHSRLEEAEAAQKETEDTLEILFERGRPPLQGLHEIRPFVKRSLMPGAVLSCGDLMRIGVFLEGIKKLKAFMAEEPGDNAFYALLPMLESLPFLCRDLNRSIIGEDELADDASPELARLRKKAVRCRENIRRHLEKLLSSQSEALQEQLITLRQDRYVLPVKIGMRSRIPGIVHDTSQSGQTLFIEPLAVVEENNKLREIKAEEEREIRRILEAFTRRVAAESDALFLDIDLAAKADFFTAKASLARSMKGCRPHLNEKGYIRLRQARHPHIPKDEVVPIDIRVGKDFRTLLITGPNTGGKTVSLKTVGLLSLMAMSGLQLPAAAPAYMSVFDYVLADIGDEQSIEQSLSTFSSHMRNIVDITRLVNEKSLVLADELGAGTDPSEGAALAIAILEEFKRAGAVTVATTHYKELKVYALQREGVENAACEFDTETLKPTYKLLIGVPGTSNAFIISRKLGLPERIIDRANEELSSEQVRFEDVLSRIDQAETESARLLESAEKAKAEALALKKEAAAEKEKIKESKRGILDAAREESRQNLMRKTREVDALLKEMDRQRQQGNFAASEDAQALRGLLRGELNDIEAEIASETLKEIKQKPAPGGPKDWSVGDDVYAPALGLEAKIETPADNKGQVQIRAGQMQIEVPADSLRPLDKADTKGQNKNLSSTGGHRRESVRHSKKAHFNPELNIIGERTADGVAILDSYIDDAVLAGAESVRIVHGKGTGALRKAVQDFLRKDGRILSFRQAAYGEGDAGVTVAELKN